MAEGDPAPWQLPEAFDEYRILRPIGRGGMGRVYLAEDQLLERPVAIKLISEDQPDSAQRQRFFMEARALARLQHPNVVAIHRIGDVQGRPYLVEEFLRGVSLKESPKPIPPGRALRIALGLARGLAAAHREQVLHRDVKPSNVMLLPDGEVKLVDFGLALLQGAAPSGDERLTSSGSVVGTRGYLAPEALRGEPPGPRSELYSVGVVLHELLNGHRPLEEPTWPQTPGAPGPGAPGPGAPGAWAAPAPPGDGMEAGLRRIIRRCLEYDPALRFASADELCGALQALAEGPLARAVPPGNPYRGLQAFEAEHRGLLFGRDAEIRAVLERLRAHPLVLVAGDSGVGKSSLCRAGVLPRVAEGALGDGRAYAQVHLVPGRRPFTALVAALAPLLRQGEEALGARVRHAPAALGRELRAARPDGGTLLFVDQLEELFTQSEPGEAASFAEALGQLALPVGGVRTLLAVRGDFLTRLAALPGLGDEVGRALFLLKPLTLEGTREAVVAPARAMGVGFESEALVAALVESSARAPGGLPILQFALAELWEARDRERRCIPAAALDALGGVAGALGRHADGVLAPLPPAARQAARGILLRLITGEGMRARRTAAELDTGGPASRAALEALVRARLVVARQAGGEDAYEVAHEALLQGWDTLRGWLESDRKEREVLHRLEVAAGAWERLGRPGSALAARRQLVEVEAAGELALTPRERDFLAASRRALRRARARRAGLAVALPLTGLLAWGGAWLKGRRDLERAAGAHVAAAGAALDQARAHGSGAREARARAFRLLDALAERTLAGAPAEGGFAAAEAQWEAALEGDRRAQDAYLRATQSLDTSLLLDVAHGPARRLLGEVLVDRLELTGLFHHPEQRRELARRLASLDAGGAFRHRLASPPILTLATEPPGAEVLLQPGGGEPGERPLPEAIALGRTPLAGHALEPGPGSYRLAFRAAGRLPVVLPLLLAPGERLEVVVPLPAEPDVPAGFVYVPPGRFLFGGNEDESMRREFLQAPPLRPVTTAGYLISRHEVTFAEWIAFLEALPPGERARRTPVSRTAAGSLVLELDRGGWRLTLQPTSQAFTARAGEPIRYPGRTRRASQDWLRFPVSAISLEDARAYLAWLDRSGRLPGARLCSEHEWERAARGADDRIFPGGDRLGADDANFDETYGRALLGYGPDEVGAHPASASPFGVMDLAGNVFEWVRSVRNRDEAVVRGGAWYYDRITNRSNNRLIVEPTLRDLRIGLRACASFPLKPASGPAR